MEHTQSIHVETPLAQPRESQAAKGGGSRPAANGEESYDKEVKLHSCLECDKKFNFRNNRIRHMVNMHKKAKLCPRKPCGNNV